MWLLQELHHMTDSRQCKHKFLHILYVQLSEKANKLEPLKLKLPCHLGPSSTLHQNAYQQPVMSFYRVCPLFSVMSHELELSCLIFLNLRLFCLILHSHSLLSWQTNQNLHLTEVFLPLGKPVAKQAPPLTL